MKRVCLITGASGILGQALCRTMSAEYDILACTRQEVPGIPSQLRWPVNPNSPGGATIHAVGELPEDDLATSIFCIRADLTDRADIRRVIEVAGARFGRVDVLVNAAADLRFHGPVLDLWQSSDYAIPQLKLNSLTPFVLASALFHSFWKDQPQENARRNASVINVSSKSALFVTKDHGQGFYAASKAALNILTMYLSLELAPYGVRANAICPGRFSTDHAAEAVVKDIARLADGTETGVIL